jgi:hypothetical protein
LEPLNTLSGVLSNALPYNPPGSSSRQMRERRAAVGSSSGIVRLR